MPVEKAKKGVNFVTLRRHGRLQPERRRRWVCACVRACACVHVCACVRVSACVYARTCMCAWMRECVRNVFAIYNNEISPRLLYFIQIRHTDDFPSTAIRLVQDNNTYRCIYMLETAVVYGPLLTFYVSDISGF